MFVKMTLVSHKFDFENKTLELLPPTAKNVMKLIEILIIFLNERQTEGCEIARDR